MIDMLEKQKANISNLEKSIQMISVGEVSKEEEIIPLYPRLYVTGTARTIQTYLCVFCKFPCGIISQFFATF